MKIKDFVPYLMVDDGKKAMDFYSKVFETVPFVVLKMPDGRVMHCEFRIGSTKLFLSDEIPEHGGGPCPKSLNATTVAIHIYVSDCDLLVQKMVKQGAKILQKPSNMFFGERYARILDPFGHVWGIGQRIKEMTPSEIELAANESFK